VGPNSKNDAHQPAMLGAWARTGATMHYDRTASAALLDTLRPTGPLHSLIQWRQADPSLRDVQLRKQPKGPASWASLYLGLTSVLDVYEQGGQFRLAAHRTHRSDGGFDPAWAVWQSLDAIAERLPQVEQYLLRVVPKVHPRWLDREGRVHALLASSPHSGISVINREASISFSNQPTKNAACRAWSDDLLAPLAAAGRSESWWTAQLTKRLGTSPDFIAVDGEGRLLVIEAKPASSAAGITGGPAQVGFYATMYASWLREAGGAARDGLQRELDQRRQLGLDPANEVRRISDPVTVVPVLAIGPGIVSPEAWPRLAAVAQALAMDAPAIQPLEVWRLAADGTPRPVLLSSPVLSPPADTPDDVNNSTYQDRARAAAVAWKLRSDVLPDDARADGPYQRTDEVYPFCLPTAFARHNLLPEAAGAVEFFAARGIQWHRGVGDGPTTHLVSSQVQCVNALYPMTADPGLIVRAFGEELDIAEVTELDQAFLTFEYNGDGRDYLGESRSGRPLSRGANSTSTDAAFAYLTSDGQPELALVEWKYTEQYLGSKLSEDRKGIRELRYRSWYESPDGPLNPDVVPYESVFVEPLYQLTRQQLLAWRIEQDPGNPYSKVRVLHVVPATNKAYRQSLDRHCHRLSGESVADVWQRMLRPSHRDRYRSVGSARFTDPDLQLTSATYRDRYTHL
jgi:hypothetical protein